MHGVHEQVRHDFRLHLAFAFLCLMAAGVLAATKAPFGPWRSPLLRDHPLAGRIIDAATGADMSRAALEERLRRARMAILGEVHDNPDHHRTQARLLAAFAKGRDTPPAVVFEMIPTTMQKRLDMILKLPEVDADMVFDAVRWDESGWPSRDLYRPLMEQVLRLRAPIIAAGLPRDLVKKVARRGLSALSRMKIGLLRLGPLPPDMQAALEKEIVKSHCDMIPREAARKMSAVQRLRDAMLADGLRRGYARQGGAVLIAGDGHARKDRAAPLYLRRMSEHGFMGRPPANLPAPLVIWQAEAREKAKTLADVMPGDAAPATVADVIVITPRARRKDPCDQFARFMKRKDRR